MIRFLMVLLIAGGVAACVAAGSRAAGSGDRNAATRALSSRCAPLTGVDAELTNVDLSEFVRISRFVASAPRAAGLRSELKLQSWPEDSVGVVTNDALCRRVDSLVVAWLAGPGAGKLTGVTGTIGNVTLTRVGTTTFHVRPGLSVPPQPNPHYPYFIVDTAAPTRVAYWGQSGE